MRKLSSDVTRTFQQPTAAQPLAGLSILLVEDSRYFAEAVRLLSTRSGARLRRADCIASARKHTRVFNPDVVLIDLNLPDGSGLELIAEMTAQAENKPAVIAISGLADSKERAQAIEHGATRFLEKPFFDLASFQQSILMALPKTTAPKGFVPRLVGQSVEPDRAGQQDDYMRINTLLQVAIPLKDKTKLRYCAGAAQSMARVSEDAELMEAAREFSTTLRCGEAWKDSAQALLTLLRIRMIEP